MHGFSWERLMGTVDRYWMDFIGSAIALACVNGAMTGKFYTHSKGHRKRLLAEVRSHRLRLVFLCAGFAMLVLVARDLIHKLA